MSQIQVSAKFPNLPSENLEAFKNAIGELVEATATEDGAINYDFFFNEAETSCEVRETYADSNAVLAHLGNVGAMLGPMVELAGGLELEVFGSPSPELVEATAAFSPNVYSHFKGI